MASKAWKSRKAPASPICFRQLGGSFGIAIVNTYVTNQTQFHRDNLISSINSDNQLLEPRHPGRRPKSCSADGYSATTSHAVSASA